MIYLVSSFRRKIISFEIFIQLVNACLLFVEGGMTKESLQRILIWLSLYGINFDSPSKIKCECVLHVFKSEWAQKFG